jgi:hypothetical protein
MQIIRKYRKLSWFDFLDIIQEELKSNPDKSSYFEYLDELRMRLLESVSEGGSYKLKAPAKDILAKFQSRMSKNPSFASEQDLEEIEALVISI